MKKQYKQKYTWDGWIDAINNGKRMNLIQLDKDARNERLKFLIYKNTYSRLFNILMVMYKWKVPDSMNAIALERDYINTGKIAVFQDSIGLFNASAVPKGGLNFYGEPSFADIHGYNGKSKTIQILYPTDIPYDKTLPYPQGISGIGVYSEDNPAGDVMADLIEEKSMLIADELYSLHILAQRLKKPFILSVNKKETKINAELLTQKIQDNEDTIIEINSSNLPNSKDAIQNIDLGINPSSVEQLKGTILFHFNSFLETIGINTNPSPDKTQVVLNSELNSNNSLIDLEQDVRFLQRKKLCENVKKVLGIDLSVEKNIDEANNLIDQFKKGVEDETNSSLDKSQKS